PGIQLIDQIGVLTSAQSPARVEGSRNVPRDASRRHQDGIEADIVDPLVRDPRQISLGGRNDARALAIGDRPGGIIEMLARLDLDEDEEMPAACDDIDLADRALPAARQDAKTFGDEKCRRPALGREPQPKSDLPLWARAFRCPRPKTRRIAVRIHRCLSFASASARW